MAIIMIQDSLAEKQDLDKAKVEKVTETEVAVTSSLPDASLPTK